MNEKNKWNADFLCILGLKYMRSLYYFVQVLKKNFVIVQHDL